MSLQLTTGSRQPPRLPWPMERLISERAIALGAALDQSTHTSYSSHMNSYISFCHMHNFSTEPTEDTLSFYIVYMCRNSKPIGPRSVKTYLSGICSELEEHFPEVRKIRKSRIVTRTLKGCKRLYSKPIKRKSPLLDTDVLHAIHNIPTDPTHDDLLFFAQLLTGWTALFRLAELCLPDPKKHQNMRKVTRRDSVQWFDQAYGLELPAHKADPFFQGNRPIIKRHPAVDSRLDPYPHFLKYVRSRDHSFPLHWQLWLRSDGTMPTRLWFMNRFRQLFPDKSLAGQSLRAGGATSLALAGAPPYLIQATGRWSSEAWLIYIRKNPTITTALLHRRPNLACVIPSSNQPSTSTQ
ncbi:hypothetical protein K435DRAFT_702524 [Dendrothele bispora CBS 962.96]|uniref:Tyr recombinase domain-containing protein n=1 Tax=Dendrothele bispora (strain CBS 962.96) TaxID=1314807 RepID=A0A4S8KP20_DENBC|nr:hypothetical protein K435DRAFT_702524 [Dendrothele bispora CBS 962.96]